MNGLEFIRAVFAGLAMISILAFAYLYLLDLGTRHSHRSELIGPGWGRGWRKIAAAGWGECLRCAAAWTAARAASLVSAGFINADRSSMVGLLFLGYVLVLVPAAALINALFGGSPALIVYCLAVYAAFAVLHFTSEVTWLRLINGLLSLFLFVSVFIGVPLYVLIRFTGHAQSNVFSHSVLESFLIAPMYFAACFGVKICVDRVLPLGGFEAGFENNGFSLFMNRFLAMIPISFVLFFLALLMGRLAVIEANPSRDWQSLIPALLWTSLSLPLTLAILSASMRRAGAGPALMGIGLSAAAAAVLSVVQLHSARLSWIEAAYVFLGFTPDGARIYLGSDFWVMHLPLLPVLVIAAAALTAVLCKGVSAGLAAVGDGKGAVRPALAGGVLAGLFAVLFGGVAVLM